jgi:putative intracellular protease/amidase
VAVDCLTRRWPTSVSSRTSHHTHEHTSTGMGIKDDLENAGAIWVDKAAFREGNLVWGRVVPDIPDFCRELVAALAEE